MKEIMLEEMHRITRHQNPDPIIHHLRNRTMEIIDWVKRECGEDSIVIKEPSIVEANHFSDIHKAFFVKYCLLVLVADHVKVVE